MGLCGLTLRNDNAIYSDTTIFLTKRRASQGIIRYVVLTLGPVAFAEFSDQMIDEESGLDREIVQTLVRDPVRLGPVSGCATRALCHLLTVDSKESAYLQVITEQASVITPQNVSGKPQIPVVYSN